MNYVTSATITNRIFHNDNVLELIVVPEIKIKYNPGSFVQLTLEKVSASERWPDSRTFSIASYNREFLRFLIQRQGKFTKQLFDKTHIEQKITLKYPFGEMFSPKNIDSQHIFIAGGLGITPFIGLTEYFEENKKTNNLKLFYSAKKSESLIFKDYLSSVINNSNFFVTQEDSIFSKGRIPILDIVDGIENGDTIFYICGSIDFIMNYKDQLTKLGFNNIKIDEWQ